MSLGRRVETNASVRNIVTVDPTLRCSTGSMTFSAHIGISDTMGINPFGRIHAIRLGVDDEPAMLIDTEYDETSPALSPDGRWLAYESSESGQMEIYMRPFPDVNTGRWQISIEGGTEPVWANSGEELFYRNGDNQLVSVSINTEGGIFSWGNEQVLFTVDNYRSDYRYATYDVSPDDQRFLMMRIERSAEAELILVENWPEDLKQLE